MTKLSPLAPVLAGISSILAIVALGLSASTLHTFYDQRHSNPWWLPSWANHFDDRGLITSVSMCVVIAVFDLGFIAARSRGSKSIIEQGLAVLGLLVAIVLIVVPTVLDGRAPRVDTVRTWTCRWSEGAPQAAGLPADFSELCERSKAVFGLSITIFILQLATLGLVLVAPAQEGKTQTKEGN